MYDGDATKLLNEPGLVADSWLNLASAIWFFLTPQAPKPAMLHVIDRTWVPSQRERDAGIGYGFGTTINIINGGIECGEQNKNKGQPVNRIRYWEGLAKHFNIPIEADETNTCWQQLPYGSLNLQGATDVLYTNWDGNWKYYADRPGGYSFECKLVAYQTAYSALVEGDYEKCVSNFYGSHASWPTVRVVESNDSGNPGDGSNPGDGTDPGDGSNPGDGNGGTPSDSTWDKNAVYLTGERVTINGVTYEAKHWNQGADPETAGEWGAWKVVSGSTGTAATTPDAETSTGAETGAESETGSGGDTGVTNPDAGTSQGETTWNASTAYVGGDQVVVNGVTYEARHWTQGDDPASGTQWGPWKKYKS